MSKLSRTKGHSFERTCAQDFQEMGWQDARRHLEYQDGEADGVDLMNTPPFLIQCKRGKGYAPINKIFEIKKNDWTEDFIPVLITKADQKPTMAVLPWAELQKLMIISYPNPSCKKPPQRYSKC